MAFVTQSGTGAILLLDSVRPPPKSLQAKSRLTPLVSYRFGSLLTDPNSRKQVSIIFT